MSYTKQHAGMILVGPLADRPAASTGEYWYLATDEDDGTLYHSNETTWTQVAAGVSATGGGPPTGSAGGALDGTYPNPGLAAAVAGAGLAETSDVLSVNVDGSTIEISSDSLRVKASGITANEIAASAVGSSELADDAVDLAALDSSVTSGLSQLVYRYTVTGSVKASIDTGADTPDAGTNDWTNGDLLEVFIYSRTDQAVLTGAVTLLANNDGSSIYDRIGVIGTNATASAANSLGQAVWTFNTAGDSANAGAFGVYHIVFPNYANTVGNKEAQATGSFASSTAANTQALSQHLSYRSTSALTRLKVTGSGGNLKIGSQLLIYKRLAA